MRSSSETRRAARTALSGNWGSAVLVVLITTILTSAISFAASMASSFIQLLTGVGSMAATGITESVAPAIVGAAGAMVLAVLISIVGSLCSYFVSSNLQAGQSIFYLNVVNGSHADLSDLFAQFKRGFMKPFGIAWLTYLKMLLWFLTGYIPGAVLLLMSSMSFLYDFPAIGGLCVFFGILLMIFGFVLMVIAAIRYSMVYYVLADNPNVGVRESVRISKELMRGHKADYFILQLSFIGWWFLTIFTCGIGILFLAPYISTSGAVFYCDLIGRPVVGDMAFFEAMKQKYGYNGGGSNNPDNTYAAPTAPDTSAPVSENTQTPVQEEAPIQSEVKFDEVDISKIGAQEITPEVEQNAENGDNPTENN